MRHAPCVSQILRDNDDIVDQQRSNNNNDNTANAKTSTRTGVYAGMRCLKFKLERTAENVNVEKKKKKKTKKNNFLIYIFF